MRAQPHATSLRVARNAWLLLLAVSWVGACGGDDGGNQGAAGAAPTPGLGMLCTIECTSGLTCESNGSFAGQCTAGCGSGAACQLLSGGSACFDGQCGLMCTSDAQCAMGTSCQPAGGMTACRVAPLPTMP